MLFISVYSLWSVLILVKTPLKSQNKILNETFKEFDLYVVLTVLPVVEKPSGFNSCCVESVSEVSLSVAWYLRAREDCAVLDLLRARDVGAVHVGGTWAVTVGENDTEECLRCLELVPVLRALSLSMFEFCFLMSEFDSGLESKDLDLLRKESGLLAFVGLLSDTFVSILERKWPVFSFFNGKKPGLSRVAVVFVVTLVLASCPLLFWVAFCFVFESLPKYFPSFALNLELFLFLDSLSVSFEVSDWSSDVSGRVSVFLSVCRVGH